MKNGGEIFWKYIEKSQPHWLAENLSEIFITYHMEVILFFPRNPFRDKVLPAIWTFFSLVTLAYKINGMLQ